MIDTEANDTLQAAVIFVQYITCNLGNALGLVQIHLHSPYQWFIGFNSHNMRLIAYTLVICGIRESIASGHQSSKPQDTIHIPLEARCLDHSVAL
jgi:hypothetical protein